MRKKSKFSGVVIWVAMLCLASSVVTAGTNIIQNGSFEFAADQTISTGYSAANELGGTAWECGNVHVTSRGVSNWTGTGRAWYHNETPTSTFPDGDWCVRLNASDGNGGFIDGVDVLAQTGLSLIAGRNYVLTFDMWGADPISSGLDVRFTYGYTEVRDRTNGVGVTVLDEKTTVGNDGVAETVTVPFNPTVTADYALQFFIDDPSGIFNHVWIDNVILIKLLNSTSIMIQ